MCDMIHTSAMTQICFVTSLKFKCHRYINDIPATLTTRIRLEPVHIIFYLAPCGMPGGGLI
jgi:hypothetical protein